MIYNDEKEEVIIKTIKTKKEGQYEQEKTGEQPIQEEGIAYQKQTLNNNTPEERTRNQTSQRIVFFFSIRVFFHGHCNSQDSRGREGTIFSSTLPLPPAHKHSDIYLQLCK